MSSSNGIVRIGRKGKKKFAFGDEGTPGSEPFEIDVVNTFHSWLAIDYEFRSQYDEDDNGNRNIPLADMGKFSEVQVSFVEGLRVNSPPEREVVTTGEASDFIARLREQFDELVVFFRPKSLQKQDSQDTSETASEHQYSEEPAS